MKIPGQIPELDVVVVRNGNTLWVIQGEGKKVEDAVCLNHTQALHLGLEIERWKASKRDTERPWLKWLGRKA